jgi:hypothetical protein
MPTRTGNRKPRKRSASPSPFASFRSYQFTVSYLPLGFNLPIAQQRWGTSASGD